MYRFLASRRWLIRIVAGLLLVLVCVRLGMWQLDRSDERAAHNAIIEANADAEPVPMDDLLAPDDAFDPAREWRQVEISGEYDADHQLVLRLRPLNGQRGVHVLTPLVTDAGAALLVDRGFYLSDEQIPNAPAPPDGRVDLVARLRSSEDTDGPGGDISAGHIRYVELDGLSAALPYDLYPAWAQATTPDDGLVALPPPEVDAGPHLSYAVQWFIFAVVGVTGFILLIRTEARDRFRDTGTQRDGQNPDARHDTHPDVQNRDTRRSGENSADEVGSSPHTDPTDDVDRMYDGTDRGPRPDRGSPHGSASRP